MNIHGILNKIIKPFRQKRMVAFMNAMMPQPSDKILDVGGNIYNWALTDCKSELTLLNIKFPDGEASDPRLNASYVIGDGTDLKYTDGAYDICFSNSVIEHVGTHEQQRRFAQEIRRVGKRIWIQTPAKGFFFEPHYVTPFVHWLPVNVQKKVLRNFSIWGLLTRPSQEYVDDFVNQTRLLTYKEFKELFPDCLILKERFLFMAKSYIAVRSPVTTPTV